MGGGWGEFLSASRQSLRGDRPLSFLAGDGSLLFGKAWKEGADAAVWNFELRQVGFFFCACFPVRMLIWQMDAKITFAKLKRRK